ncbi:MAG: hypothetical protein ACLR23_25095 [Clostridia bacterium]
MTNRDRLLILFEQLIAFDSPSYGEREICDFIKGRLADLGIAVCEDGTAKKIGGNCGNLYAYVDGALNLPPLLFLCPYGYGRALPRKADADCRGQLP